MLFSKLAGSVNILGEFLIIRKFFFAVARK